MTKKKSVSGVLLRLTKTPCTNLELHVMQDVFVMLGLNKTKEIGEAAEYKVAGEEKTALGVRIVGVKFDNYSAPRKMILLAKNRKGLKNICKILSLSNNKEFSNTKDIEVSYENILNNRECIIVGMECTRSDLYQVWTDDEQDHEGEKTYALVSKEYEIADFIEIQRWKNYTGMMGDLADVLCPEEVAIKWLLNELVGPLEAVNKYAIAADIICKEHALTSEELMDEYSQPVGYRQKYFGTGMARKIVLDNPKAIADMIED